MVNDMFLCKFFYISILFFTILSSNKALSYQNDNQSQNLSVFDVSSAKANTPMPTDTRIKTFVYNPNEIFQVKFMVGYESVIELQKDEEPELVVIGDPAPWTITPIGRRLFVKVSDPGVKTNMTIITDKRTYLMEIMSNEDDYDADDRITYILRFFYPNVMVDTPPTEAKIAQIRLNSEVMAKAGGRDFLKAKSTFANVGNMNTNYTYSGTKKTLIPITIFDDGKKTYFKFPDDTKQLPLISFIKTIKQANGDIKYDEIPLRVKESGEYFYVDVVEEKMTLRDDLDVVCVFNENYEKQQKTFASTRK